MLLFRPPHRDRVDPERQLVARAGSSSDDDAEGDDEVDTEAGDDEGEGYVARIYATRAQVRAMAARGAEAVAGGRPLCPLCDMPMDPAGHACPRWN